MSTLKQGGLFARFCEKIGDPVVKDSFLLTECPLWGNQEENVSTEIRLH